MILSCPEQGCQIGVGRRGCTFKEYDTTIQNLVALAVPPSRIHYLQLNKIIISSGLFHRASFSFYLLNNKRNELNYVKKKKK